jgi:hypothetical protein
MLVRALLLVCLLTPIARADSATSASQAAVSDDTAAAVPVDKEALISPTVAAAQPVSHDLDADPLFVPGAVLIGSGGVALVASLFTGLGADSIYRSLERDCKQDLCTPDRKHRIDSGKSLAVVSTVLTGVGIVAAGIGTAFMIVAALRQDEPVGEPALGTFQLSLTGGPTPLGLGATARF